MAVFDDNCCRSRTTMKLSTKKLSRFFNVSLAAQPQPVRSRLSQPPHGAGVVAFRYSRPSDQSKWKTSPMHAAAPQLSSANGRLDHRVRQSAAVWFQCRPALHCADGCSFIN